MNYAKLVIICLFCFISCKKTNQKEKLTNIDSFVGEFITIDSKFLISPDVLKTNKCESNFKLVITFNGECSACVMQFLEFLNTNKTIFRSWNCLFIAFSDDVFEIEYYLRKNKIKLSDCQKLFPDKNSFFLQSNTFIDYKNNVFILDNKNKIVEHIGLFDKKERTKRILQKYNQKQ